MAVAAIAASGAAVAQTDIEPQIGLPDAQTGKTVHGGSPEMIAFANTFNGMDEGILSRRMELSVVTIGSADLTESRDIGTYNTTVLQDCFYDWEAKSFNDGRCQEKFAMPIAPLQLCVRDSVKKHYMPYEAGGMNEAMNACSFRTFNADDDK